MAFEMWTCLTDSNEPCDPKWRLKCPRNFWGDNKIPNQVTAPPFGLSEPEKKNEVNGLFLGHIRKESRFLSRWMQRLGTEARERKEFSLAELVTGFCHHLYVLLCEQSVLWTVRPLCIGLQHNCQDCCIIAGWPVLFQKLKQNLNEDDC